MRNTAVTSCYSAKTYFHWGMFPPVKAPNSVWREWFRLHEEAGNEIFPQLDENEMPDDSLIPVPDALVEDVVAMLRRAA